MDQKAIETLVSEAASSLSRAAGNAEAIRGAIFLYLSRAYELRLDPELICDLLGVSESNILTQAKLSKADERSALEAYESLDPILAKQYE